MESFRQQVLEAEKPVLLVFWAPQVQKSMDAVGMIEKVVEEANGAVALAKLDHYRNKKTATTYKVEDIPTVILFDKGVEKGRLTGDFTAEDVKALIK